MKTIALVPKKTYLWSGSMFGQKKIKRLEERVKALEKNVEYLLSTRTEKPKETGGNAMSLTAQEFDEWLNGGKK